MRLEEIKKRYPGVSDLSISPVNRDIAWLIARVKQMEKALEEIILVPGENGPIPGSSADEMCEVAEQALAALQRQVERAEQEIERQRKVLLEIACEYPETPLCYKAVMAAQGQWQALSPAPSAEKVVEATVGVDEAMSDLPEKE